MTSTIPILNIRRRLGRETWGVPAEMGPDGWILTSTDGTGRIILTAGPAADDEAGEHGDWRHASMTRAETTPSYEDLVALHAAVWPNGYAYQVFAPPAAHINIHARALHLWGRPDGTICLPDFGAQGTI